MQPAVPQLVILGASVRAAAFSAIRAGVIPLCGDLFADADLTARCVAHPTDDYPAGLMVIADSFGAAPWMYTGGLENYPHHVERLLSRRPLLGNGADVLRKSRDPLLVAEVLRREGFDVPECMATPERIPRDGSWLVKRRHSSGGRHVKRWTRESRLLGKVERHYWQRHIEGLAASAAYVAADDRATLLGVTQQRLGSDDGHVDAFRYSGSRGPIEVDPTSKETLDRMGTVLAERFGLHGLFGVDLVLEGKRVWPIEANPRYTASMEILERSMRFSAVGLHIDACCEGRLPASMAVVRGQCEKRVVYASRRMHIKPSMTSRLLEIAGKVDEPKLADIPRAGAIIESGAPFLTVFTDEEGSVADEIAEVLDTD